MQVFTRIFYHMEYSPLAPEITRNPYPTYAALRREAPVYRTPEGLLAVSRYADVLSILRDSARFSSAAMGDLVNQVKSVSLDDARQNDSRPSPWKRRTQPTAITTMARWCSRPTRRSDEIRDCRRRKSR